MHRRTCLTLGAAFLAMPAIAFENRLVFRSIDGGDIDLSQWRGKPVIVVNTASQCGFTYQYDALQALHEDLGDGALVLAAPSDDFGGQEYATEAEVKDFCEVNFGLTLPMTEIIKVRGRDAHPFYQWAAQQGVRPRWNFHKILLDGEGQIVEDFPSTTDPGNAEFREAIADLM